MVVRPGRHFEFDGAAGGALGIAGDDFQFPVVVLARLGDVQVPHSVVSQLLAGPVDDRVVVEEPHDARARVARHPAESRPLGFHHLGVSGFRANTGFSFCFSASASSSGALCQAASISQVFSTLCMPLGNYES